MVRKKVMGVVVSAIVISIILCVCASAITGSIGNARMILHVNTGDTIERTVRVNNVNDVPIRIEIFASGDLASSTKILDNNFTLNAGESKDARFEMKVKGDGTFTTSINVKFIPDTGNGVGLSATIIAVSNGNNNNSEYTDESDISNTSSDINKITGNAVSAVRSLGNSPMLIVALITSVFLLIFLILLIILYRKSKKTKRRADRSS